jgi:murein L,D-transpeptidase YcbB/YkuD
MGRVKLFFMPLYFIHGTPAGESIGTPASHGCVRMLNEDVIALARLLHQRAAPEVTAARLDQLSRPSSNTQRVNFSGTIEINIRYDAVEVTGSEIFVYPDIYSMNRLHSESVYQALMRAGYSPDNIDYTEVRRLIDRAQGLKAPLVMKLDEVFSAGLVQAAR